MCEAVLFYQALWPLPAWLYLEVTIRPSDFGILVWMAAHGMVTLAKPARADYLRLGPIDRQALVRTAVARAARLVDAPH